MAPCAWLCLAWLTPCLSPLSLKSRNCFELAFTISAQSPHPSVRPSPSGYLELIRKSLLMIDPSLSFLVRAPKALSIHEYSTPCACFINAVSVFKF